MNQHEKTISVIRRLFDIYGNKNYIGEEVSQIEHAIQCALMAENEQFSDEQIVGCFLHDLGHLLEYDLELVLANQPNQIVNSDGQALGVKDHDILCQSYLEDLGFPESITVPIGNHCQAKRYLVSLVPDYYNRLSPASQETFEFQGGSMTLEEMAKFEQGPYFDESVNLRFIDDQGKIKDFLSTQTIEESKEHYLNLINKIDLKP